MDTKPRTTKQGLRDLNFYGSRKKLAEAAAAAAAAGPAGDATLAVTVPIAEPAPTAPDMTAAEAPSVV